MIAQTSRRIARQLISGLLATLLLGSGLALAQRTSDDIQNGVKLRGDGSVDDTRPAAASNPTGDGVELRGDGSIDDAPSGTEAGAGSISAKLARIGQRREKLAAQEARALARLSPDDPRRAEIAAKYDKKEAQLDARQARLEARQARGEDEPHDAGHLRQEDRQGDRREDRRADRREDRRAERAERTERSERVERAERIERTERPERIARPEKVERPERAERPERSGRSG